MVTATELLAVSTGLTWSISALVAMLCYNCRRSRCTSLKFCGIEIARDVMTASEMAEDPAPNNPQQEHHISFESPATTAANPLWEDRAHHPPPRRPASIDENKSRQSRPNSQVGDTTSEEEE